jgi:enoyl-CoA hydratase
MHADEAEKIGLITRACDEGTTLSEARSFAGKLAAQAPVAARMAKAAMHQSLGMGREDGLRVEREHCLRTVMSADAREGFSAFVEKRKPKWTGK